MGKIRPPAAGRPKTSSKPKSPRTPDGRYLVVRGRLWRTTNPGLSDVKRSKLVLELMLARRQVKSAKHHGDVVAAAEAHKAVDRVKRALGERGPVWWNDGAPDYNRHMAKNTPYADWYAKVKENPP